MKIPRSFGAPFRAWNNAYSTYQYIDDKIRLVSSLNLYSVCHAAAIGSVLVLNTFQPITTPLVNILCTAVAFSILKQAWQHAEKARRTNEENEGLAKRNANLTRLLNEVETACQKLEEAMKICLEQPLGVGKVGQKHEQAAEMLRALDAGVEEKVAILNKKVEALSLLCQQAGSQETLMDRFKCVRDENERLSRLTTDCATTQARLDNLNRELESTHAALKQVVEELRKGEIDLRSRVQEVEKRLLVLIEGRK